ncbi:unnamed protein product [Cochlearia groenlandica]
MPNTKEAKALPGQSSPSRQSRTQKRPRHCPDNKAMLKSNSSSAKAKPKSQDCRRHKCKSDQRRSHKAEVTCALVTVTKRRSRHEGLKKESC